MEKPKVCEICLEHNRQKEIQEINRQGGNPVAMCCFVCGRAYFYSIDKKEQAYLSYVNILNG